MYTFAFGQISEAGQGFKDPQTGVVRPANSVPFTSVAPYVGESIKFSPNDRNAPLPQPGYYLVVGRYQSGKQDNGRPWTKITGWAVPMTLSQGEKAIPAIFAELLKLAGVKA